jgi:ketosteroid isomerase-like protein
MRGFRSLVVMLVVVAGAACAPGVDYEQEKAALLKLDSEWRATTKNPEEFAAYFAPSGTLSMAGMPSVSGDAIKDTVEHMATLPGFAMSWKALRANVSTSGDLGYTAGSYEMTTTNAAGGAIVEQGKYQATWKKFDGTWKVIEDVGSPNAATILSSAPVIMPATAVKWGPAPSFLPQGAQMAIISGNPTMTGPFTIRLQLPNGYKIMPHTHTADEHLTVLSGVFSSAMGKVWADHELADLGAGSYAVRSAEMPHYAIAKGVTVVQVHGIGPYVVHYVNDADDPAKTLDATKK